MAVAIVATAAAILAPAARHAALTPNALICQANLRAIGLVNMLYADDNNDCMTVAMANYIEHPWDETPSMYRWFNLLGPYAGTPPPPPDGYYYYPPPFICPDVAPLAAAWISGYGVVIPVYDGGDGGLRIVSHNVYVEADSTPFNDGIIGRVHRRAELKYPAQRGWMGDSLDWHLGGNATQTVYDPAGGYYPNWSHDVYGNDPRRHGAAANYLFIDGHVESLGDQVSGYAFTNYTRLLYPGDFSGDGVVNQGDYTVWADSYGKTGQGWPADANHDGTVDQSDYTAWADHFGETQPPK